jgi:hypothetical protein
MTKEAEALKQAFEAFEHVEDVYGVTYEEAMLSIEEALAQPEQEPVAFQNKSLYSELISAEDWENIDPVWYWMYRPLYTSPPKPEWVGLTDEQIRLDAHNADSGDWNDDRYQKFWHEGFKEGARGAESMLKESNT